jgi:hypothetical protein
MGPVNVKSDGPYSHRFPSQTDEYKFRFIGLKTDKYNLNILFDTGEFKNIDE